MNRPMFAAFLLACVAVSTCPAQNRFTVVVKRTGTTDLVYPYDTTGTVNVPSLPTAAYRVWIIGGHDIVNFSETSTNSIGGVILSGGPSGPIDVVVGVSLVTSDSPPTPAALNVNRIDMGGMGPNVRFGGAVYGNITGDLSGADYQYRFDAGGTLSDRIIANSGSLENTTVVHASSISGSVLLATGTLKRVQTTSGNLSGTVRVDSGLIQNVVVAQNLTGTVHSPNGAISSMAVAGSIVLPTTGNPRIGAKTGIGTLTAQSVTGVISTTWDGTGNTGTGRLGRLVATNGNMGGALTTAGLDAAHPTGGIYITGNLTGAMSFGTTGIVKPIRITGDLTSTGSITSTGAFGGATNTMTIGGSLAGSITLPSQGLVGQVIANANNSAGTWTGAVTVGSTTLSPTPSYTQAAVSLGGGAVGLVPFNMHALDSEPDDGDTVCTVAEEQTWPTPPNTRETIKIGTYGRVFDSAAGGSIPLVVERKDMVCGPPPCSPPWVDISADCEVLMSPNGNDREVWISMEPVGGEAQSFGMAYFYRITPRGSGDPVITDLRSDDTLAATAPNVYAFEYNLTLLCDAFASMLDRDGFLSADSLEAWAHDPTDVNGDSVVDSADLAWFLDRVDR